MPIETTTFNTSGQEPKKKKLTIFILIGLSLCIGALLALALSKTGTRVPVSPKLPSSPAPTKTEEKPVASGSYFLNRTSAKTPVTGFSWDQERLIYSTPGGIFSGGTNEALVSKPIDQISWSANGYALFHEATTSHWYWFRPTPKPSLKLIDGEFRHPVISPDGLFLADVEQTHLQLVRLDSSVSSAYTATSSINQVLWGSENNALLTTQRQDTKTVVTLFDRALTPTATYNVDSSAEVLAVSPTVTSIAMVQNNSSKLQIQMFNGEKTEHQFNPGSLLASLWLDEEALIVLETSSPDPIGRRTDYIWKLHTTGEKELLSSSQPIPRKLDTSIRLFLDPKRTVLPLAERQNTLWLLSLVPDVMPIYTESGLSSFPIPASKEAP